MDMVMTIVFMLMLWTAPTLTTPEVSRRFVFNSVSVLLYTVTTSPLLVETTVAARDAIPPVLYTECETKERTTDHSMDTKSMTSESMTRTTETRSATEDVMVFTPWYSSWWFSLTHE